MSYPKFIVGDLVNHTSLPMDPHVVVKMDNTVVPVDYSILPLYRGATVKEIVKLHKKNENQKTPSLSANERDLILIRPYDPVEDEMICCGREMNAVGLGSCNGFQCKVCGHTEPEIASAKLGDTFEEVLKTDFVTREYVYWFPGQPLPIPFPDFYQWQRSDGIWCNAIGHPNGWHPENGIRRRWQSKLQGNSPEIDLAHHQRIGELWEQCGVTPPYRSLN